LLYAPRIHLTRWKSSRHILSRSIWGGLHGVQKVQ
jgi:hypothetical protein